MALVLADRVQETSTTSGTGAFTLNGAVSGYQSFATGIGSGNTVYYAIYDATAFAWETGLGTFTAPSTLTRTTVFANSLGTTAFISFAGNTTSVFATYPGSKAVSTDTLASPPAIGSTAANTGAFTTLSASSTVSGTGFSTYLASPPAIGGTAAAAGSFTTLTATTSVTTPIVQNSAAAAIAFKTNSATSAVTQFNINHTASAVNYVQVTGRATGNGPQISAQGSDAAINLEFLSKVNGAIKFFTGTSEQFRVPFTTGTIVNYATATGAITGSGPIFSVAGTDADIDLTLTPKGAGRVNITTSIKPKVSSAANVTSPLAWNSTSFDEYAITALANALTINADANASPADGQRIMFRFKDNGTARALTWTTGATNAFRAVGVTLPTTTVASKLVYIGCIYNSADSRWDAVAVSQEA